jgi:RimJ/RimL family protein N-acetyltransferase
LQQEWLDDESSNRQQGFGKGSDGRIVARDGLLELLKREDESDNFGLIGVFLQGEPAGLSAVELTKQHRTVDMNIFIRPDERGTGYGSALLKYFLEQFFSSGIYRVQADILRINKQAVGFARANGFTWESTKKSSYWMDDDVFDVAHMRMLRPQWKELQSQEK